MVRAAVRAGTLEKAIESTSPAQSIPLLSRMLTCAGAGLSQRLSLLFWGSRRQIPQGRPQPMATFRAQKVKKKKKPEQKAAAAPCPLPTDVRWLLPNPPGQQCHPAGGQRCPLPSARHKGGVSGAGAGSSPLRREQEQSAGAGNSAHFHANERSRFHPAARGKLERKSRLERMQLSCPMSVAGLQHQFSPSVYF